MKAPRVILISVLVLGACEQPGPPEQEATLARLQAEIEALKRENEALKRQGATVTATAAQVQPTAPETPPPDWVKKGTTFTDEGGARFGVGVVNGIRNPSLARLTAENRARAEIAKVVGTKVDVSQGDGATKIRSFSATLSGVEIVEHWADPKTGAIYALARLPKSP